VGLPPIDVRGASATARSRPAVRSKPIGLGVARQHVIGRAPGRWFAVADQEAETGRTADIDDVKLPAPCR